jgi:hypothetical protein
MVQEGVDSPLRECGFNRVGKRLTWTRDTGQLLHIVNVWTRWGRYYMIQWGIRCEPVTTILWGVQRDPHDVAYSAITGRARGDGGTWEVDEERTDDAVTRMADATATTVREVATWLGRFQTRHDALALSRDDDDDKRQAPSWLGSMHLFAAASFAAVDQDLVACGLADELRRTLGARREKEVRERMGRLMEWIEPLCQGSPAITAEG